MFDRSQYTWLLDDDSNRAGDGEEGLRWQFAYSNHISINHEYAQIKYMLDADSGSIDKFHK